MQDSWKEKALKYGTIAFVLSVIVGGFVIAWPDFMRGRELRRQVESLSARIEDKKQEIAVLKENQRRFATDRQFIETIARQKHRVYPGELVFVYEDE